MPIQFNLPSSQIVSNSQSCTKLRGGYTDDIPFDILLRIDPSKRQDGFRVQLYVLPSRGAEGRSLQSRHDIFLLAETCRRDWVDRIVNYEEMISGPMAGVQNNYPFQDKWQFECNDFLERAAPQLAVAGSELFESVFESECDDNLRELAEILRQETSARPRYIRVTSDEFFLPWGMLYTHPIPGEKLKDDGSNWVKEGFWGYKHVIQHNPIEDSTDSKIKSASGTVPLSINLNEKITSEPGLTESNRMFIDDHFDQIEQLSGAPFIRRTRKHEIKRSFCEQRNAMERILYFYCHGHGSTTGETIELGASKLILTDGPISAKDFERWSRNVPLPTQPLIFINACQGGQMTTMFYQTLAFVLLKQGASGVVGAQIDIPAIFAAAYALSIFHRFLKKSDERTHLGPVLRDVNQIFWDIYKNPLGLVYSLYRGANCSIDWKNA